MTATYTLQLLGGFNLLCDGAPVSGLTSRKAQALLIYLACTRQPYSREKLADMLWDATSTEQSLSNLRTVMSRLRPHLGDWIQAVRDTVTLADAAPLAVDVVKWEAALAEHGRPVDATQAARLDEALQHYRGDFLAGFHVPDAAGFVDWALVEKERLHYLALQAHRELAAFYEAQDMLEAGLRTAQRLLTLEPLDEAAHAQLMRLLARSGQRAAALAHYDSCCNLFAAELDAPPTAALTAPMRRSATSTFAPAEPTPASAPTAAPRYQLPQPLTPLWGAPTNWPPSSTGFKPHPSGW
ncbi:MAG: BTAD domain-containing putative transcriptional regulator [Caldilineaceae bacterium]